MVLFLAPRVFLRVLRFSSLPFLPSQKSTLLNSSSIWKQLIKSHIHSFIHSFIYLIFCCFPFSCSRGNKYRSLLNKNDKEGKLISNLALKIDGMKGKDALGRGRWPLFMKRPPVTKQFEIY